RDPRRSAARSGARCPRLRPRRMTSPRPDPDALLKRLAATDPGTRGRLKVFFGASPGVGKTYAMLEAARARRAEGVDVVIGWVETHGRAGTAALAAGIRTLAP